MKNKEQLHYLLERYLEGEYTTEDFTDEFSRIYHLEVEHRLFSEREHFYMNELAITVNRFSPSKEDLEKFPSFYLGEDDIRKKVNEIFEELQKD